MMHRHLRSITKVEPLKLHIQFSGFITVSQSISFYFFQLLSHPHNEGSSLLIYGPQVIQTKLLRVCYFFKSHTPTSLWLLAATQFSKFEGGWSTLSFKALSPKSKGQKTEAPLSQSSFFQPSILNLCRFLMLVLPWKQGQKLQYRFFFQSCLLPQLYPNTSLYSSGTLSGSTGRGKKCVNFWCLLDLAPSLGVPSLLSATKYRRPESPCLYTFDE